MATPLTSDRILYLIGVQLRCACARDAAGSVTSDALCPVHARQDPCLTMATITGRRRRGTIRRGTCTNCGHVS